MTVYGLRAALDVISTQKAHQRGFLESTYEGERSRTRQTDTWNFSDMLQVSLQQNCQGLCSAMEYGLGFGQRQLQRDSRQLLETVGCVIHS